MSSYKIMRHSQQAVILAVNVYRQDKQGRTFAVYPLVSLSGLILAMWNLWGWFIHTGQILEQIGQSVDRAVTGSVIFKLAAIAIVSVFWGIYS